MSYVYIALTVIFLFVVCVALFDFTRSYVLCKSCKNWEKAKGTITKGEVKVQRGRRGQDYHYDVVEYTYQVGEETFTGNKASFSFFRGSVYEDPKNYEEGQEVTVYYNPRKQAQSVLNPPKQQESYWPALIPIFITCIIGAWLVMKYS